MNILTDSPLISESPQESSARNLAIGQSFASSFLSGFNRGIERKREDERWAELKPLRDAQLASQQAQAEAAKSQVQLQAIQVAKQSMMQGKMAEFAALEGEIAFQEYSPEARVNFMGWLEKNPEFYGSQFHKEIEGRFENADKARADKQRLDETLKTQKEIAIIREGNPGTASSNLTIEQREMLRRELDAIDNDVTLTGREPEKAKRRAEVYRRYGVREPSISDQQPADQPQSSRRKVVIGPDGKPMFSDTAQAESIPKATEAANQAATIVQPKAKRIPDWLDAFMKLGPTDMR